MARGTGARQDERIARLLDAAEREGRCCFTDDAQERRNMRARVESGRLVSPFKGLFARRQFWDGLGRREQMLAVVLGLAAAHPDWRFCSFTAGLLWGLEVPLEDATKMDVWVATSSRAHSSGQGRLRRRVVGGRDASRVRGVKVTGLVGTAFDCIRDSGFARGLAIADSTMRVPGLGRTWLVGQMREVGARRRGLSRVLEICSHADPRAENGGESIARANMIELGALLPELQVEVADPLGGRPYRVDFLWELPDGRRVAGELDGRDKYQDPRMTGGRDSLDVFSDERLRESRLTASVDAVMRFSYADACSKARLGRLLRAFGIPLQPRQQKTT